MSNSVIDSQERLFDYEVVRRFVDIDDADEETYRDFVLWLDYHHRDRTRDQWTKFQRYLGAEPAL
jgi:hypothetical protein